VAFSIKTLPASYDGWQGTRRALPSMAMKGSRWRLVRLDLVGWTGSSTQPELSCSSTEADGASRGEGSP
jgi:hypothetical protein